MSNLHLTRRGWLVLSTFALTLGFIDPMYFTH